MTRYYRKVIRIRAADSPNVELALLQEARGEVPTGELLVEGVLPYHDYLKRRATWDPVRQSIGLDAEFYEGSENLMFPPEWLNNSERLADLLGERPRTAEAIGVDPAEGGDDTSWAVVDRYGLIEQHSRRTPDTNAINNFTLHLMTKHRVGAGDVMYDRGGGGKQHADALRSAGHMVRTAGFGEAVSDEPGRGRKYLKDKIEAGEQRAVYKNRRAQMYGWLREELDPRFGDDPPPFSIPARYADLRRQLAPIPLLYDAEGRTFLPPKDKPSPNYLGVTLRELLGRSPDDADALVLAVYAMLSKPRKRVAGGAVIDVSGR